MDAEGHQWGKHSPVIPRLRELGVRSQVSVSELGSPQARHPDGQDPCTTVSSPQLLPLAKQRQRLVSLFPGQKNNRQVTLGTHMPASTQSPG